MARFVCLSTHCGYWLAALAFALISALSATAKAQDFTIVALPDTQYYAQDYPATMTAQTQWIANNVSTLNIKAVIGLGDVVNGGGVGSEWTNADNSIKLLEGKVPYFITIGNHDYNKNDPQSRTASASNFNNHFGPSRYANSYSGYGGSYSSGSNENFWGSVTINGKQYIFILLEFYPRMAVLQWAAGVIRAHPSAEVMLVTHAYEYNDNNRIALCNQYNAEYYSMGADNDGDEMWVNLASQFSNVSMVLSGHIINGSSPSAGHQSEPGFNGNLVNELMADYQNLTNGGNGYLRILKFQPSQNQIVVSTYSPTLNAYLTDSANSFTIPWHKSSSSGTGTITGRLKNTSCSAVSGAKVSYSGGSTTTDSSGKFTLTNVPAGVQAVTVQAAGYPAITKLVPVGSSLTSNPLFYVSTSTGSVTGKLTDVSTGNPIAGATVSSSGASTTTNSSGVYTLSAVSAVSAQLTASAAGYANLTQQISVTGGATATLNFALTATSVPTTGAVTGVVTNSTTGATIPGAVVQYSGGMATTNSQGSYTLTGVPKGTVTFTASASGMQNQSQSVSVVAASTTTQNFALAPIPTGSVTGTVLDTYTGLPIAYASVAFSGGNAATDASGKYTLSNVPTGTQTITASATGYQGSSQSVNVAQNSTANANFSLRLTAAGSLSGTVTDAITGLPILGASITYRGGNVLTNDAGYYSLSNVPTGTSQLSALAAGYVENDLSVTVTNGQNTTQNIQLVPIPTFGTVQGTVTDAASGTPIAGAAVSCGGVTGTTGSDGTYQLASVPTGSQTLVVDSSGYQEATKQIPVSASTTTTANVTLTSLFGNIFGKVTDGVTGLGISGVSISYSGGTTTTDVTGAYSLSNVAPGSQTVTASVAGYQIGTQSVTVTAGQPATANFALIALPTTGSVTGVISDAATSLPIAGASVTYGAIAATTDASGTFTLSNVPEGTQTITASAPNYDDNLQDVQVVAGSTTSVNIALSQTRSPQTPGNGSVSGVVVDAQSNAPLQGVTVSTGSINSVTDENGAFSLTGVNAGTVAVSATLTGYTVNTQTVTVNDNQTSTQNFALTALTNTGTVSGTITDSASGSPISRATITYSGGNTTSDSDGNFTLTNLPPGSQAIQVVADGYASQSATVTVISGQNVSQSFALVFVPTTGTIMGTVTDAASGNPLLGANVSYSGGSTTTDATGNFTLSNAPTGTVSLTVSLSGYTNGVASVSVGAGQTATQNFALSLTPRVGSVAGHVTDGATGSPLSGATVAFSGGSTTSDVNGAYTLSNLPTGSQTLTVSVAGYNTAKANVTVVAGSTTSQDFGLTALPTTGSATGHVKDANTGAAIAGASISSGSANTTSDNTGAYTLPSLPTGSQSITAAASGYSSRSSTVMITAGSSSSADFLLAAVPTTGSITGLVSDAATSAPIVGATVSYAGAKTTTDSSGNFSLTGVPAGTQSLSVTASGYQSSSASVKVTAGSSTTQNVTMTALPKVGTISGKVTNSSGGALVGATVAYSGGSAVTDANGNYSLTNVAVGAQTVTASLSSYTAVSQSVTVSLNQTTTQNFTLSAATGTVTGTITNVATNAALAGATISYSGGSATSSSSGTFTLSKVPPGTQSFTVSLSGYTTVTKSVTVTSGQSATLNVALSAATGTITGKITNAANGAALSGATITVAGQTTTSNPNGVYTVKGVAAGTYTVTVKLTGWTTQTATAKVTAGSTLTLNVPLSTTGELTGTVKKASGALDAGATVTIKGGQIATTVTLTTSSTGVYKTGWIPVGQYTVTVSQTGHTTKSQTATISAGKTTTLNFTGF